MIDLLRAVVRETSSRQTDNALRQLDDETEASLMLFDVLGVLERGERDERTDAQLRTVHRAAKAAHGKPAAHNSLAGSGVSIVRSFLNRVIGLDAMIRMMKRGSSAAGRWLGDETGDGQAALNAGEEFDTEMTRGEEEERERAEYRKRRQRRRRRRSRSSPL